VLAQAGLGSRRNCEELILQGRVTINNQIIRELGTKVDASAATIHVDGQKVRLERNVYFAVNKPKGYVSTNSDPAGRPRVVDLLPDVPERVYTVGRLDEMSVGLMLLTNDGELANKLAHPKFGVEKVYRVIVAGLPSTETIQKLVAGIWLSDGKVRAKRAKIVGRQGDATIVEMVLAEGKNREVRRMLAKEGHKVMSLTRIAVGPITIKGLAPGEFRPLGSGEVELLRKVAAGLILPTVRTDDRKALGPKRFPVRPAATGAGTGSFQGSGSMGRRPDRVEGSRPAGPSRGPAMRPRPDGRTPQTAEGNDNLPRPLRRGEVPRPLGLPPSQRPRPAAIPPHFQGSQPAMRRGQAGVSPGRGPVQDGGPGQGRTPAGGHSRDPQPSGGRRPLRPGQPDNEYPIRSEGPPQGRPGTPVQGGRPTPRVDLSDGQGGGRIIIGMDRSQAPSQNQGPRLRRPASKPRPPRSALGQTRRRPETDENKPKI
jgi:23S rRNA pseudouridine2605 synthase